MKKSHTTAKRLLEKYIPVPESGCWLWVASTNKAGYGQINDGSSPRLAHRVSWQIHNGDIPEGMLVCHKCDTPSCINPDHLFIGSNQDNMDDMVRKERFNPTPRAVAQEHGMSALTNEMVLEIFKSQGPQSQIAKNFGVCLSTVNHIKSGRQWNTVTGMPRVASNKRRKRHV